MARSAVRIRIADFYEAFLPVSASIDTLSPKDFNPFSTLGRANKAHERQLSARFVSVVNHQPLVIRTDRSIK